MKFKYFLAAIFFLGKGVAFAQNTPSSGTELVTNIPVAPNAASLGKYGDIHPDLATGIPQINIPLYDLKSGDITVPISVSYHSGGVKVEEIASWVGAGWSLNAGGVITRTVRGNDDLSGNGYLGSSTRSDLQKYRAGTMTSTELQTFKRNIYYKSEDTEPDMFYFNFGGYSGYFFINAAGSPVVVPKKHWKIEFVTGGIKITAENGFQYFFLDKEHTTTTPYGYAQDSPTFEGTTAWYLSKIVDTKGNTVIFNYAGYFTTFNTKAAETKYVPVMGGSEQYSTYYSVNEISAKRLSSITFSWGTVTLTPETTGRQDLSSDNALSTIKVANTNNTVIKNYRFYYGYFAISGSTSESAKRLRLDSIREESTSGQLRPYIFEYNNNIVDRNSNSQDSWGYYNGKNNSIFVSYELSDGTHAGADRSIDHNYDQASILQKITYPTGGNTQFTYGGNDYSKYLPGSNSGTEIVSLGGSNGGASSYLVPFSTGFSVSSSDYYAGVSYAKVKPDFHIIYGDNPAHAYCTLTFWVTGPSSYYHVITDTTSLQLPAGTYTLHASIETEFAGTPEASFNISLARQTYVAPHWATILGPGVRIQKIANFIGTKEEDVFYTYNTFGQSYSSGTIQDLPGYKYANTTYFSLGVPTYYNVFSSVSNYPLISFNSSYVVYSNVTETRKTDETMGKSEYTYTNFISNPDYVNYDFPYAPNNSFSYSRGLIKNKKDYKWNGTTNELLHEDIYDYYDDNPSSYTANNAAYGLKMGCNVAFNYTDANEELKINASAIVSYFNTTGSFYKRKQTSRDFDGSQYLEKVTISENDTTLQEPYFIKENKGNGKVQVTKMTYPENYSLSGSSATDAIAIELMKTNHITNVPIEKVVWLKSTSGATDSTVIGASLATYAVTSVSNNTDVSQAPLLQNNYTLANGTALSDFLTYTSTAKDSRYTLINTISYNAQGNIMSAQSLSNASAGYHWGYLNQLPVAEAKNATAGEFYTDNFEESTDIHVVNSGAHTGSKYYSNSSYSLTWTLPNSRTYVLTYWYLSGGVWKYSNEQSFTGSVTLSGGSGYDDIRIYPIDAQIVTYTFEPLSGVTSITDNKGAPTYYEYDAFQRLINVKDKDGNIIKHVDYHFQNQ
jgi:YD repeat-containing protein